jgi:hypothetical protein
MMRAFQFLKKHWWKILLTIVGIIILFVILYKSNPKHEIIKEAYIYGYPLVTMDMVRLQETNVAVSDESHAPMGQMIKLRSYPSVDNRSAAAPNSETLYTMVWLDVSTEPWVFSIPDMGDRFYIMPMLSAFNEVFFVAGTRATGSKSQTYVITGPGWSGKIPEGLTEVKAPTGYLWILGRVYCTGTPEDYEALHKVQDQYSSVPLSSYGKDYTPPVNVVDPNFDMKTSVRELVNSMPLDQFFNYLAKLLVKNPPKPEDAPIIERMAEIGIVPGKEFDPSNLPVIGQKLDPKLALLEMVQILKDTKPVNGWLYFIENAGNYGTDYTQRALVTLLGPGLNFPEDAVYPFSQKDASGEKYDGSEYKYVIHFDKGMLPPVNGFWSITMYDKDFFFVPNSINRYNVSQRDKFKMNDDGSIDLYIQADSPGIDKESNWLPAPKDEFILMMRLYFPKATSPSILDGSWTPPPVKRVEL